MQTGDEAASDDVRSLLVRMAVGMGVLLVLVVVLAMTLQEPLLQVSQRFVDAFGIGGVFVGVLLLDMVPMATHEPLLFFGYTGGLGYWPVMIAASAGSVLSGVLGWYLGGILGRHPRVQALFERYHVVHFFQRYGVAAVAVAAVTPFPFAIATWASGAAGLSFRALLLGALFRVPKVLIYLTLIVVGWAVGT